MDSGFTTGTALNLLFYDNTNGTNSRGDLILTLPEKDEYSTLGE